MLAEMQTLAASRAVDANAIHDAIGSAIDAGQIASTPADRRSAAQRLVLIFSVMTTMGYHEGPFSQAEEFLREALADAAPDDWPLRSIATVGISAAIDLRAAVSGDESVHAAAAQLIAEAEALLPPPEPTSDWYAAAHMLYAWTTVRALKGPGADPDLAPVALRVGEMLEAILASQPTSPGITPKAGPPADQLKALREAREHLRLASERPEPAEQAPTATETVAAARDIYRLGRRIVDQLTVGGDFQRLGRPQRPPPGVVRPDQAALQNAVDDLHSALGGVVNEVGLRRLVDEALGRCSAELYWSYPQARTMELLRDAIVHLNRAVNAGVRQLPTPGRADLLNVLACCWREVAAQHEVEAERVRARLEADRAARAAIRELARCVLLAEETAQALLVAARANELVARSIGWCLSDGNSRAAVEIAEAGRGLVLAGVVLAGHIEEVLRGAGEDDLADAWRQGGREGRIAALDAMWKPDVSARLLAAPTLDEISIALSMNGIDALVYLTGPGDDPVTAEASGHAVLVRPLTSEIEVLKLPGIADGPLAGYLTALDGALAAFDPDAIYDEGFRGGPGGSAWTDALVELGSWTHEQIMGPLIEHVRDWKLDHLPHLALIPLGELAAIPYAAAWTPDTAKGAADGGMRSTR